MTLNKEKIKERLELLKNPFKNNSNKNMLKLEDGETVVRILPTEDR